MHDPNIKEFPETENCNLHLLQSIRVVRPLWMQCSKDAMSPNCWKTLCSVVWKPKVVFRGETLQVIWLKQCFSSRSCEVLEVGLSTAQLSSRLDLAKPSWAKAADSSSQSLHSRSPPEVSSSDDRDALATLWRKLSAVFLTSSNLETSHEAFDFVGRDSETSRVWRAAFVLLPASTQRSSEWTKWQLLEPGVPLNLFG